jgi:hypothetical protein
MDMMNHRILSVITEEPHGHVVAVETARPSGAIDWYWPLNEMLGALEAGESFYTLLPETGEREEVDAVPCPVAGCSVTTLTAESGEGEDMLLRLVRSD